VSVTADAIPHESLGRPIHGPRALTDDWVRFWHLTFNIALTQWKLRFFGSALGYLWQLVRPLLMFAVLWVFFTKIGKIGDQKGIGYGHYGAQLLGSIVLFTFFAEATTGAVRGVVDNEALVRKIQFPRMVIPLSNVLLALFNLGLNLVVVFIFALGSGVRPMLTWFELPLIVALLAVFAMGLAMLLSALYVYFRDIAPIWEVVAQILFYASPVIVSFIVVKQRVSGAVMHLYALSPLTTDFEQFRHAVITHGAPPPSTALGGPIGLIEPIAVALAFFAFGFWVFNRSAPYVAENL
jgi:ABC-2 type transport system permease protein